jgi:hypothetical protein
MAVAVSSGCIPSELLPGRDIREKAALVKSGEITGTVSGLTPWERISSIIKIVNDARTEEEKKLLQVSGVGAPLNVRTSNRSITFSATYIVHILEVQGNSPQAYDAGAVELRQIEPYRRILIGLLKLSFQNLATYRVNVMFIWPDGVLTSFAVSQADWNEFVAGKVPLEQFLTEHSMTMPISNLMAFIMQLVEAGVDPNKFLDYSLRLFLELQNRQRQPQSQPQPPSKKP